MNNPLPEELLAKIRDFSGLRVVQYDHEKLHLWLDGRIKDLGLKNSMDYLSYLVNSSDLSEDRQMLSDLLTTGETFFMRDPGQMELIQREILPKIISKNRYSKKIKLWAPACSSGEEVYSLIILLEKVLPNADGWDIEIIGSDINPNFIERAKLAEYGNWAFRECGQDFKKKYFERIGDSWKLINRIKSRARFIVFDLVNGKLPDAKNHLIDVDLIVCRNLFIYMSLEAINKITDKLSACLAPSGVLITAHGELHAYRQSGLSVKIYPESLVYIRQEQQNMPQPMPFELSQIIQPVESAHINRQAKNPVIPTVVELKLIPGLLKAAWRLADQAKFDDALAIYREILARDPMLAELHYLHAIIAMEKGDIESAKEDLRKTLYLDPNYILAYLNLITIQIQENKLELAAKSCIQALRALESLPADLVLANLTYNSLSDVKNYLQNLQNSLTSSTD